MSDERVVCSHHLTIHLEELQDGCVAWHFETDEQVEFTAGLSLIDLAECNAPLATIGIRALWSLCNNGLVRMALAQANDIRVQVDKRAALGPDKKGPALMPKGAALN